MGLACVLVLSPALKRSEQHVPGRDLFLVRVRLPFGGWMGCGDAVLRNGNTSNVTANRGKEDSIKTSYCSAIANDILQNYQGEDHGAKNKALNGNQGPRRRALREIVRLGAKCILG
jgi:hypothetical protein